MVICERILCIPDGYTVVNCMMNYGDIRIITNTVLMLYHETAIQTCSRIIRTDTENPIRNGHRFRIENGGVTTQSNVP